MPSRQPMNKEIPGVLGKQARIKIIFLALSFYFVFGLSSAFYFLPIYYAQSGIFSAKDAGLVVSIFYVSSIASRPFLGSLTRMLGFTRIFILASFLWLSSSTAMAFSEGSFRVAFLSRIFLGLGSSIFQIGLATYQAVAFSEKERGQAYSLIMAGGLAPMMTIVPLMDWILHAERNRLYILSLIVICFGAAASSLAIPGLKFLETPAEKTVSKNEFFNNTLCCVKMPSFRLALLSIFFFSVTDGISSFMSSMTRANGLMASYFLSSNALIGVFVRVFFSKLLNKWERWKLSAPAIFITSSSLLMASIFPSKLSLVALGLIFGIGMGFGFPLNLALPSDNMPKNLQFQAVSISWFVMSLSFSSVPLAMGILDNFMGPVASFRLLSLLAFAGACLIAVLWIRLKGKSTSLAGHR
jgi:MFS family permease